MNQDSFSAELTDYHVHCNHDGCASEDMTLTAIYAEAVATGLREICVLKHYSHALPNRGDGWVSWKRTRPEELDAFLNEFQATPRPPGLRVLSGVETELLNAGGDINIPDEQTARLDIVLVSNHWLPDALELSRVLEPLLGTLTLPPYMMALEDLAPLMGALKEIGPEPFVRAVCEGNASAVLRHPKVRVLAHLDDGFHVLRAFRVPVDDLSDDRLLELAAPVMDACVKRGVLWELTPGLSHRTHVVHEASRRGVAFTGTVDAHFQSNPRWGHTLSQHVLVEDIIRRLGVTRGRV